MPGTSKARNPRGYEIEFDEESHTYKTVLSVLGTSTGAIPRAGNDPFPPLGKLADTLPKEAKCTVYYCSGTKLVGHFFPPFDPDGKIAERKALKMGITAEELRFQWKQKAAAACELGTRVHETCEDVLKRSPQFRNLPKSEHERALMAAGYDAAQKVLQTMNVIGIEQIVFDLDSQIAGTIDLLCQDKNDPLLFWILDWKTNEKIEFHNRYGVHGLHPIEHLEECNGVHYGLQLSLYEWLLRIGKYVPVNAKFRRGIFHLTDNGPKFYELPDYSREVQNMVIALQEQPPF